MTIWFLASFLIAVAVIFTLWPFLRRGKATGRLAHAIAFYEAREAELLRQKDAGEISGAEYEAAIAEQARTLIALGREEKPEQPGEAGQHARRRKIVALLALMGMPAITLALYARIGAPAYPDQPLVARKVTPQTLDIASALQKIEAHLARNPDDGRGYEVVAPVYLRAGRYDSAAFAFRRVVELRGESPTRLADLGESLVAMGNGVVNAEARRAFKRALELDPAMAKARFYMALAREQDGDAAGALADLRKIAENLPEGPARMRVTAEIERFEAKPKAAAPLPGGEAGPAIAALPKAERDAVIRAMVEGLETRLTASGGTLEEWRRLVQSLIVIGEQDRARTALDRARKALAEDGKAGPVLDALAAGLAASPPDKAPQEQGK